MSIEDNKALVQRYLEHDFKQAAQGNPDVLHQYFADHYHNHTPVHHELHTVEGLKELAADVQQAAPDFQLRVIHMAAEGDLVFAHWRTRATHQGRLHKARHLRHLEPSGQEHEFAGITLYRLEGGKIVESWNYDTRAELLHQS